MKKELLTYGMLALVFLGACNNADEKPTAQKEETGKTGSMKYAMTTSPWGMIGNDTVYQYTITNPSGIQVRLTNYGGTVTQLLVPDRNGKLGDVVLGYDQLDGYRQKDNPYMGCLVGRYANRIANASFVLDGKTYKLAANDHGNSLHGGLKGFDKVIWSAIPQEGDSSILFEYTSKDGEEGYPGNVTVEVMYTLEPDNSLRIVYTANTDHPTPVNLSNHSYFNLSAGSDPTILNHELQIEADLITAVDDQLIPTGEYQEVKGTPMDFTGGRIIGKDIAQVKGGYDHNWVLRRRDINPERVAYLYHQPSGRYMEVYTTEPGLQFYSGNFLDGRLTGKNGQKYVKHAGLCLEAQHFPDSPHQPEFPSTILNTHETYRQITLYKFSVK